MVNLPVFCTNDVYEISPSKIVCLGLNYMEHIQESVSVNVKGFTKDAPEEPVLFPKTPNVLIGNGEDIVIPAFLEEYDFEQPRVDLEAELAIIVADTCKHVKPEDALKHIYGFTCMNDVSQRNLQNGDRSGWYRGKSLDTFGPIGPRIVKLQEIGDPQNLDIVCRLNGKTVQDSNTRHMIFPIPEIIAFITKNFTLYPGDIILTGTPSGVTPLKHGDTVEVEIEKIGVLQNRVVEESKR